MADVVFISALIDNMRIFENNKLYVSEPVGEWGLAIIISLLGVFVMFSAGRMWAAAGKRPWRQKSYVLLWPILWLALGSVLVWARLTLAAESGLNPGLIFEAAILFLLFVIAGVSMFAISQNFVSQKERDEVFNRYAIEEINICLEQCLLIKSEQDALISQIREMRQLESNRIDKIITAAIINNFRTRKGIIVSEEEVPYRYMR